MPFEVFISYASQDKPLREELEKHLAVLRHRQLITHWHEGEISPGTDTEQQIREHLNTANLILLLISPDFLASDLCYSMQMQQAMTRHDQGQAHVLPILLRRVYYQGAPFAKLQPLPRNGEPVTVWPSQDDA
jgi:TIR domain